MDLLSFFLGNSGGPPVPPGPAEPGDSPPLAAPKRLARPAPKNSRNRSRAMAKPTKRTVEDQNHHKHEVVCFMSGGREICVPISELRNVFKAESRDVNPWTVFKIMAEFIAGFDFLKRYKKAVSIYGSARDGLKNGVYEEARQLGFKLSKSGFAVITGGGPGIMEAANQGAFEAGGKSVGINIKLPFEQRTNKYVKESESFSFFFTRKVMLETASSVYIFFPGGYGTLDEFFEMITLIQTRKIRPIPIVLVGKEFWGGLVDWMVKTVFNENGAISGDDLELFHLVENAGEAYDYILALSKSRKYHNLFN